MDENHSIKKQKMAIDLNMKFDEVKDLFSDETLNSMRMEKVLGGNEAPDVYVFICPKGNCGNCNCGGKNCEIVQKTILCVSLDLPSLPPTPTLTKPSSSLN